MNSQNVTITIFSLTQWYVSPCASVISIRPMRKGNAIMNRNCCFMFCSWALPGGSLRAWLGKPNPKEFAWETGKDQDRRRRKKVVSFQSSRITFSKHVKVIFVISLWVSYFVKPLARNWLKSVFSRSFWSLFLIPFKKQTRISDGAWFCVWLFKNCTTLLGPVISNALITHNPSNANKTELAAPRFAWAPCWWTLLHPH